MGCTHDFHDCASLGHRPGGYVAPSDTGDQRAEIAAQAERQSRMNRDESMMWQAAFAASQRGLATSEELRLEQVAAAERRAVAAEQALADFAATVERAANIATADHEAAEAQRVAYARQVAIATEALWTEHAEQLVRLVKERDDAREHLAFSQAERERVGAAYAELTTACAERDESKALCAVLATERDQLRALGLAAEARERATEERYHEMFEQQAEAVRFHTKRADEAEARSRAAMEECEEAHTQAAVAIDAAMRLVDERDAARAALLAIRQATNLALPSEQTGKEWERTIRVPLARLLAIDAAVAGVLGEPVLTGEPLPALYGETD